MTYILVQIEQLTTATGKLSESGIVAILLFLLLMGGSFVGLVSWKVFVKLFGDKAGNEGVVTKVAAAHVTFLSQVSTSVKEGTETAKETAQMSKKIDSTINKMHLMMTEHKIDRQDFARVWRSHVRILRKMAIKVDIEQEIDSHLDSIEKVLDDLEDDQS